MSKDYTDTLGRVAPGSANPEVAVNDALAKTESGLTEIAASVGTGGLPEGGTEGQILSIGPNGLVWIDPPTSSGGGGGGGGTVTGFGSHTRWRVYMHKGSGYFAYAVASLVFLNNEGAVIPTTGGAPTENGHGDSNSADRAFDSNAATYWNGPGGSSEVVADDAYLGYNFAAAAAVFGVKITARNDGGGGEKQVPNRMTLEYSDDGKTWIGAYTFGGARDYAVGETRTYTPTFS